MQSGITASQELHDAFNTFVSSPSQRGLLASIKNEILIPTHPLPSTSTSFLTDLSNLLPLLNSTTPVYILLRRHEDAPDGFIAITYVPDAAPVRQKMLFASTRLTLVRELGAERFRETLFVTEKRELEPEGWKMHEQSKNVAVPLTEEEKVLEGVKEAEAQTRGGTEARKAQFGSGVSLGIQENAKAALEGLRGGGDTLVQLMVNMQSEVIELAGTSMTDAEGLATSISDTEPRFSFFKYAHKIDGSDQTPLIFIYTCPPGSKIKERMVYASSKAGVIRAAEDELGFEFAKKLEASSPHEITGSTIEEEFHPKQDQKQGFSRPKRPGKR